MMFGRTSELSTRLGRLESEFSGLQRRLSDLEDTVQKLRDDINTLRPLDTVATSGRLDRIESKHAHLWDLLTEQSVTGKTKLSSEGSRFRRRLK